MYIADQIAGLSAQAACALPRQLAAFGSYVQVEVGWDALSL